MRGKYAYVKNVYEQNVNLLRKKEISYVFISNYQNVRLFLTFEIDELFIIFL